MVKVLSIFFNFLSKFGDLPENMFKKSATFSWKFSINPRNILPHFQSDDFDSCWYIQDILIINMFTCIASSIWLFYAGLNRMMVLVYPGKVINAWGCWIVRGTLTFVAILSLVLSILYQKLCGVYTHYDAATNTIQMMATSTAEVKNKILRVWTSIKFSAIHNCRLCIATVVNCVLCSSI